MNRGDGALKPLLSDFYLDGTSENDQYKLDSVYVINPSSNPDCGMLIGILNYAENGNLKHMIFLAFMGTESPENFITDARIVHVDVNGHSYHGGFYATAENQFTRLQNVYFELGNGETITFKEYLIRMNSDNDDYQLFATGHSLGAAVANIFVSYFIDYLQSGNVKKNTVAYTFASPLYCSNETARNFPVNNIFNFINDKDIVPAVGGQDRQGIDLVYSLEYAAWFWEFLNDHQMTTYKQIMNHVNHYINDYLDEFIITSGYTSDSKTYYILYSYGDVLRIVI